MFDMGFAELLLVAVVGLLVIGPERLPGAIRTTMVWVNRIRRSFDEVRADVQRELHNDAVMRELRDSTQGLKEHVDTLTAPVRSELTSLDNDVRQGMASIGEAVHTDTASPLSHVERDTETSDISVDTAQMGAQDSIEDPLSISNEKVAKDDFESEQRAP